MSGVSLFPQRLDFFPELLSFSAAGAFAFHALALACEDPHGRVNFVLDVLSERGLRDRAE